jgi:predicted nucleotidyltransferase
MSRIERLFVCQEYNTKRQIGQTGRQSHLGCVGLRENESLDNLAVTGRQLSGAAIQIGAMSKSQLPRTWIGRYNEPMKTIAEIKEILQAQKPYLAERYGVTEIGVFGSYVRGEQRPESDLDILIELEDPPRISLLGLVNLENYLSDLLGVKVQVAIKEDLKPRLSAYILEEVEML